MLDATQYKLLTEASEAAPAALGRPHRELQDAVLHYLNHRYVLVTFPEKVQGTPVLGMPPEVEVAVERTARPAADTRPQPRQRQSFATN